MVRVFLVQGIESSVFPECVRVAHVWPNDGPWGFKCIFNMNPQAFNVWWASNPGVMTRLFAWWIEHASCSCSLTQMAMLDIAYDVFMHLDWGALRVKQMFAAEVRRLEIATCNKNVQNMVSRLLTEFPEIREVWLQSIRLLSTEAQANWPMPPKAAKNCERHHPWYLNFFLTTKAGKAPPICWCSRGCGCCFLLVVRFWLHLQFRPVAVAVSGPLFWSLKM